jgi:hypothetical protein
MMFGEEIQLFKYALHSTDDDCRRETTTSDHLCAHRRQASLTVPPNCGNNPDIDEISYFPREPSRKQSALEYGNTLGPEPRLPHEDRQQGCYSRMTSAGDTTYGQDHLDESFDCLPDRKNIRRIEEATIPPGERHAGREENVNHVTQS